MGDTKLIFTGAPSPPALLEHLGQAALREHAKLETGKFDGSSEAQKRRAAKDFESVLLSRLFDEMRNTVGDWGFEKDGVSEQVQGIFWLYLARHVADEGGFGLWKDVYQALTDSGEAQNAVKSLG
ncbi:MAG: hypothetical protein ACYS76_00170 [Planctomycetota bacterium]|jgi:Rod binding domain-containing protein